ncbi:Protein N-acetyltransferase, RimJ/RimL family [Streptomyces sp. DconLS]|uniref:N-acetyltransferase n=2 Tax=Streptomyces TaxID=1883 RepID=A0A7H1Q7W8_9ACTN|nr:N-acetyltransferase [Streptomyces griseofuscus]BBC97020.1 N-acetyltransferase [Streptomyces rochei]SCF57336.1 Protein N-acetyltransferase, RimJ/RimL family [Streptomyces sp. DconLS]SCG01513.1 Protein N-acetyltransferase, RimJ/RimL family [Streptomyces sp. LamerLS-31b]
MSVMPILTSPVLTAGALARIDQPVIPTGDGLVLRPWRAGDAPAVHAAFQDPLMHRFHGKSCESEAEAAGWITQWQEAWAGEREPQWAVVAEGTERLLGRVALRQIELADGSAELAYWTVAGARGRNVATRSAAALTHWAFEEIGFHRLELMHSTANEASCRVAAKAGFAPEGTRRKAYLHLDGWHDMHLHARVRGD